MGRVIIGIVAGILLGVAGMTLWHELQDESNDIDHQNNSNDLENADDRARGPARREKNELVDSSSLQSTRAAAAAHRVEMADEDVLATIRKIELMPGPEGSGEIRGTIRSDGGEPLAGVFVTAAPRPGQKSMAQVRTRVDAEASALEMALLTYRFRRWTEVHSQEVRSDDDGHFAFSKISSEHEYQVSCKHEGWRIEQSKARPLYSIETGANLEIEMQAVTLVRVAVSRADGVDVDQSTLTFMEKGKHHSFVWHEGKTEFHVPSGTYEVTATAEDGIWKTFKKVSVGTVPINIELILEEQPLLVVKFPTPKSQNLGRLQIAVLRLDSRSEIDPETVINGGESRSIRRRNNEASFQELEEGRYAIVAFDRRSRNGKALSELAYIDVVKGRNECRLKTRESDDEPSVLVHLLGPNGKNIEPQYVRGGSENYLTNVTFSTVSNGALRIPHPKIDERIARRKGFVDDGRRHLEFSTAFGLRSIAYRPGEDAELTVRFEEAGSIVVRIVKSDEVVASTCNVRFRLSDGPAYRFRSLRGRHRVFESNPLQPGQYLVEVTPSHDRGGQKEVFHGAIASREVRVAGEKTEVEFVLPTLHELVIEFPEESTSTFELRPRGDDDTSQSRIVLRSRDRSEAVVSMLPPGEYELRNWGQKKTEPRVIHVPATKRLRLE